MSHSMLKNLLVCIVLLFTIGQGMSQTSHKCAIHYYDSIAVANDPAILERRAALNSFTKNFINKKFTSTDTLVIPVVVHVLHQYGIEHISKSTIERGIEKLNLAYKAQNTNLGAVIDEFKSIIGTAKIEIRLAKIDPNGKPTDGIVYYDTKTTVNANEDIYNAVKNWDASKYLNIRTVLSTESGAAAWSHYPGVDPNKDGIVCMYQFINSNDHTLAHEMGHYLNLAHPWGDSNEPGLEENCDTDDDVTDTPNTIGVFDACNLTQESCGSLDNIQNIMDYSNCPEMFTKGQVLRMRAALNAATGNRNNLWKQSNLEACGVNDDYVNKEIAPIADFSSEKVSACPGSTINFTNFSYAGEAETFEWTFEGGTPASSTDENPSITYNNSGEFSVILKVKNNAGENTLTREKIIKVTNIEKGIIAPALITMNDNGFPSYNEDANLAWTFENNGINHWDLYQFESGNKALRIDNRKEQTDIKNAFITSNINLKNIENPDQLTFNFAYAKVNADNNDQLKVYVSNNCGKNWALRSSLSGDQLVSNGGAEISDEFIPTNSAWKRGNIDFRFNAQNDFVMLKFEVVSNGGNYLYIDDISIGDITNILATEDKTNLTLYPNPANEMLFIELNNTDYNTQLKLINIVGKTVWSKNITDAKLKHNEVIDIKKEGLNPGVYLINISNKNTEITKRVIISK